MSGRGRPKSNGVSERRRHSHVEAEPVSYYSVIARLLTVDNFSPPPDTATMARSNTPKAALTPPSKMTTIPLTDPDMPNPKGLWITSAVVLYIAGIPLTTLLARNSLVHHAVSTLSSSIVTIASVGAHTSPSTPTSTIAALSTLYATVTFALSGVASVAGVDAAHAGGRDNLLPRAQERDLKGLPLRLKSAHLHLLEMFGGYVLAVVLALGQGSQPEPVVVNLLGMHVIAKVFL